MLGWDPSSDPHASGYNVYYGTVSHVYTHKVSAGTGTTVTINGLVEGVTYYFAATTCDISNQESSFSEEIPYTVPGVPVNLVVTNILITGQNIIFNAATGNSQSGCQWQFNAANLAGATNAVLVLTGVTTNQSGIYSVTVGDGTGGTTNLTVNLLVYATAAASLDRVTSTGGRLAFNVSGVPGFQYVVQASTNLVTWVPVQTNNSPFDFIDTDTNRYARRFFRSVAVFQPPLIKDGPATNTSSALSSLAN
jgi:hypothetical protein